MKRSAADVFEGYPATVSGPRVLLSEPLHLNRELTFDNTRLVDGHVAAVFLTGVLILPDGKQHALNTGSVGVTFALARLKRHGMSDQFRGIRDQGVAGDNSQF